MKHHLCTAAFVLLSFVLASANFPVMAKERVP